MVLIYSSATVGNIQNPYVFWRNSTLTASADFVEDKLQTGSLVYSQNAPYLRISSLVYVYYTFYWYQTVDFKFLVAIIKEKKMFQ